MILSGYIKTTERKNGGIRYLGLIDRSTVGEITYDSGLSTIKSIELKEPAKFALYEFREDEAEYKEVVTMPGGSAVVSHELRFLLEQMGDDTTPVIDEIARCARSGLVAVVITFNGNSFVVGLSPEFGTERPLRIKSVSGTTGRTLKDSTGEVVTLYSEDVSKARSFTGKLDSLFEQQLNIQR